MALAVIYILADQNTKKKKYFKINHQKLFYKITDWENKKPKKKDKMKLKYKW